MDVIGTRLNKYGETLCINQHLPTNPFKILELQNPSYEVPELRKIPRPSDLEALKL